MPSGLPVPKYSSVRLNHVPGDAEAPSVVDDVVSPPAAEAADTARPNPAWQRPPQPHQSDATLFSRHPPSTRQINVPVWRVGGAVRRTEGVDYRDV